MVVKEISSVEHSPDAIEELEVPLETVKSRAVRGIAILTGRGFILNAIAQVSQIFLLAFLAPSEIGVFWITSAAVSILIYFSDVGLAASLIQKKDQVTEADLKTTFTIQTLLISFFLALFFLSSPYITRVYGLSADGRYLMFALGISLFLSSLKTIPSVLLERKLQFAKFVIPEILESLVYNVIVVVLASKGFGITSFTYAVLARAIVGLVAMYLISPWRVGFAFSKSSFRGLLHFGAPYQLNSIIALAKDQGVTLLVGGILGSTGVGYLGTAQRLSQIPLRLFMDSVTKVSFPAFARMQHAKEDLARSVTRSIMFITFLVFPLSLGFLILAPVLIDIFPKYKHWEPSLIPLFFMTTNTLFASVTTQLTNMLSAVGRIKLVTKLIIMWTALTLVLVPVLSLSYGVNGAALAYALVGSSSVIAIYLARRVVSFSIVDGVLKTLVASLIMSSCVLSLRMLLPHTPPNLIVMILTGGIVYLFSCVMLIGASVIEDAKKILKNVAGR